MSMLLMRTQVCERHNSTAVNGIKYYAYATLTFTFNGIQLKLPLPVVLGFLF